MKTGKIFVNLGLAKISQIIDKTPINYKRKDINKLNLMKIILLFERQR